MAIDRVIGIGVAQRRARVEAGVVSATDLDPAAAPAL